MLSRRRHDFQAINDVCTARPVNTSVAAKQASKMLVLLWSLGLLFTAIITSTLSRTVKGQEMPLMMIVMKKLTSSATLRALPSVVIVVTFVIFDPESLAMLINLSLIVRADSGFYLISFN